MQHVLTIHPNKDFIKFCNNLRCPLCDSQLDGNISTDQAELYCVSNNGEYRCHVHINYNEPFFELIRYWYPQYEYTIQNHLLASGWTTIIDRYNSDYSLYHKDKSRVRLFEIHGGPKILFFRKRMEEDVFLKKLKTYQTFS